MPKLPPKAVHAEEAKNRAGKLRLYEILYTLNQGFEQVLHQLQELEKLGLGRPWQALQTIVEENRAEVNFELVERLQERELRDWTHFGRLRGEGEKQHADSQDGLLKADRLRQKKRARGRGDSQK